MTKTQVLALLKENQNERGIAHWKKSGKKGSKLKSFGIGLTQLRKLAKQHRYELLPTRETFRITLGLTVLDRLLKLKAGEDLQQLTEKARGTYHGLSSGMWGHGVL